MTGIQQKLKFKKLAADKAAEDLVAYRVLAKVVARERHVITIEDVREEGERNGWPWKLGNAAGSLFDGDEWEPVGYVPATREAAHGRILRRWRLRDAARVQTR